MTVRVVAVGGSWGGLPAAQRLLAGLRPEIGAAVVVVLHRSPHGETGGLEHALGSRLALPVVAVEDHEPLRAGAAYLAPADYHLLVQQGELVLSTDEPVQHARPSLDVTFESMADAYGADCAAVVLSGANADGADGARRVRAAGGLVLVQDPAEAEQPRMPAAAVATGAAHVVAPVDRLAELLPELLAGAAR